MKKEITTGTRITFTATTEKYSILEKTGTGFIFKPIKFEKNLPTVPRTFGEMKNEFLAGEIDIENFEHNDADNRLVELILEGYMKDTLIADLTVVQTAKAQLDAEYQTLKTSSAEFENTIRAHEATIAEQQEELQLNKNTMQGMKDEAAALRAEAKALTAEKENWLAEEEKYKQTIEGLEASIAE